MHNDADMFISWARRQWDFTGLTRTESRTRATFATLRPLRGLLMFSTEPLALHVVIKQWTIDFFGALWFPKIVRSRRIVTAKQISVISLNNQNLLLCSVPFHNNKINRATKNNKIPRQHKTLMITDIKNRKKNAAN